jgi:hypothetical protein
MAHVMKAVEHGDGHGGVIAKNLQVFAKPAALLTIPDRKTSLWGLSLRYQVAIRLVFTQGNALSRNLNWVQLPRSNFPI